MTRLGETPSTLQATPLEIGGRAIREAREQSGLSEREVANIVHGVSLAGVRAIEAGDRPGLNYAEIIRLAGAVGVAPGSLFVRAEGLSAEWRRPRPALLGLDGPGDRKMAAEARKTA